MTNYARINAGEKVNNTIQLMYTVESQAPNPAVLEGGKSGKTVSRNFLTGFSE